MQLSNQAGRALVTTRTNHVLVASAPLLGHPAEEVKPPESMLAALATCDIFVYAKAAHGTGDPAAIGQRHRQR